MKLFRYREPSIRTVLGVTRIKKEIKRDLGITAAMKPLGFFGNAARTVKRRVGYYSEPMKVASNGPPRPTVLHWYVLVVVEIASTARLILAERTSWKF